MYQNEHSRDVVSTWIGCGGCGFVVCFHSLVYTDDRLFRVRVNLALPKVRLTGCWKLNSLFGEKISRISCY